MDFLDDEIISLWKALNENQVKYILVGGFATNLHGYNRITADMDIWLKDTTDNRSALRQALKIAGLGDFESMETTQFVPGFTSLLFSSGFELDLMTDLKNFPQVKFDDCYKEAPTAIIENIPVKFLHIKHLVEEKKSVGRPKDLLDIEELKKLKGDQ